MHSGPSLKRAGKGYQLHKQQITTVICGALSGEMLPIQLVYKGTTKNCHLPYKFPDDWLISHSLSHWSNEGTMIEYINEVIVPFVDQKRDDLDLSGNYPAVAIFDHFKGQLTEVSEKNKHTLSAYSSCIYWGTSTHGYICK